MNWNAELAAQVIIYRALLIQVCTEDSAKSVGLSIHLSLSTEHIHFGERMEKVKYNEWIKKGEPVVNAMLSLYFESIVHLSYQ